MGGCKFPDFMNLLLFPVSMEDVFQQFSNLLGLGRPSGVASSLFFDLVGSGAAVTTLTDDTSKHYNIWKMVP